MLLDFTDAVLDYLERLVVLPSPFKMGGLDINETGVSFRVIPSGNGERYFQGRTDLVNFQILTKFKDQRQAMALISEIAEHLTQVERDQIPVPVNTFRFVSCDIYTAPTEVEKTANYEYIWTALFTAEIEKIGGR